MHMYISVYMYISVHMYISVSNIDCYRCRCLRESHFIVPISEPELCELTCDTVSVKVVYEISIFQRAV